MHARFFPAALVGLALAACGGPDDDPMTPASESSSPAQAEAAEGTVPRDTELETWIKREYGQYGRIGYRASETDLDGDGEPEVVVYIGGPMMCGTGGCNLAILKRENGDFIKVTETSVTQLPIGQLDSASNGWADLWVTVAGGGELTGRRMLRFDGRSYPTNPTVVANGQVEVLDPLTLIEDGELIWLD